MLFLAFSGQAHALYVSSTAYLHSGAFTTTPITDGGPDEPSAAVSGTGTFGGSDFTSNVLGSASGTAQGGHLEVDLAISTSVSASAPGNRSSTFAIGRSQATDWFHVEAGTSGLANGTPVTVELQVQLDGFVSLNGAPSSDGSDHSFWVSVRGITGRQVELIASPTPPDEYTVDPPRWTVTLDTTVGGSLIVDAWMEAQIGNQIYPPGAAKDDRMWFVADYRITQTAAFPGLEVVSEAGAPIEPIAPMVPAMSVPGRMLLSLALVLALGAAGVLRQRRHAAQPS